MKIVHATDDKLKSYIEKRPEIEEYICDFGNGFTLFVVDDNNEIVAYASAWHSEIVAPINGKTECIIEAVDVSDTLHNKGIGSMLVQEIIKIAQDNGDIQVRAYCHIENIPSHMFFLKNGFGFSPYKYDDGSSGSMVTYRINAKIFV